MSVEVPHAAIPLLAVSDIVKTFPGVRALDGVSFELLPGEVHALVGENGAGKSTLMKIIAGLYEADSGIMKFGGSVRDVKTAHDAEGLGVGIIHQEFHLIPHLTVAQNIFIGREPRGFGKLALDERALNRKASELLDRLGMKLDPRVPVSMLTVGAQQMVEIAKALSKDARILIMDEPTAALTEREVDRLFELINEFLNPTTGVIYISHRMEEIRLLADRITVLRDGASVGTRDAHDTEMSEIIKLMVGRELSYDTRRESLASDEIRLQVEGLSTEVVNSVSFDVRRGEILGFAGLMGSGRTEVARAVVGADSRRAGEIKLDGKPVRIASPADSVRRGIAYLSEDRKGLGVLLNQSIRWNVGLPSYGLWAKCGAISDSSLNKIIDEQCSLLGVKTPSYEQVVKNLSGGNQQKVVIAKWLARDCDILIFDEPTRGIDVGAKEEIYQLLDSLAREGKAIIVISSELQEVMRLADRIAVMCNGSITGILDGAEATQEAIMALATQFSPQVLRGES